jgi:hypothetical protein
MSVAALPSPSVLPALAQARAGLHAAVEVPLDRVQGEELASALEQAAALESQAAALRLAVLDQAEERRRAEAAAGVTG